LELGRKDYLKKIRSVYEETLSIVRLETFPTLALRCESGVVGADWNKEKGIILKNPLTFWQCGWSLLVGHSAYCGAWL
jgi:hypothetical protein